MIYLLNDRLIHIQWSIFKGTSQVREDFSRALVKVFLIGPDEKYLLNATAQNGTLAMDVPQGLPEGAYSIECIYVKNYENLLPVRGTLTPSGEPVCHRFPWSHPHNPHSIHPHDHRSNDRCLMRSRMDYVFALTSVPSEADRVSSDGEATLRFKSSVASYGYDGLSAYEIAVMRGDFNGSEGEWLDWMASGKIDIDDALSETSGNPVENRVMTEEFNKKQNSLVSGKNIKTVNGQSILGEGNISITGEGTAITVENEFGQSTENPGSQKLITQVNESVGKVNESIKNVSDSVNAIADDEDLVLVESENQEEEINKKLKFADKAYNASAFSGMGRAYLRKNMAASRNVLTQAMVGSANTRYIIQYDYDLNGKTITVPEGCTLDFQGGSLRNGTLVGNNTAIASDIVHIFTDVTLNGSYAIAEMFPQWFGAKGDGVTDDTNSIQAAMDSGYRVILKKGDYLISSPLMVRNGGLIGDSPKNTSILINSGINALQLSKDYITDNRSSILIRGFTITGSISHLDSSIGIKFIDTASNQYIKGVIIEDLELNDLGRGLYLSQCFRVNVNKIGMTRVINPIKLMGSIVQSTFVNVTCNLDYTGETAISKVGLEATDASYAIESLLFSKCSFVSYDYGVNFTAPTLITNFEYMDLDFCNIAGMILGNNCFTVSNSWICITGENAEAGIILKTNNAAFSYPITVKGCTFMSNISENPPYFIVKEGSSDYRNKLIVKDNLFRAYDNKKVGGIILAEKLTNFFLGNNILTSAANQYYSVNLKTSYGNLVIENNNINGRLYLSTVAGVASKYVITDNTTSMIELFNNALESGNGHVEFLVDRNSGSIIANNKTVSSLKYGTTSERNDAPYIGFGFFDTTINKPIWWNGTKWVDSSGNAV